MEVTRLFTSGELRCKRINRQPGTCLMVRLGTVVDSFWGRTYQFRCGLSPALPVCKNSENAVSAAEAPGRETVRTPCRVVTGAWARSPKLSRVWTVWPVGSIGIRKVISEKSWIPCTCVLHMGATMKRR